MVKMRTPEVIVGKDGVTPVMHQHNLICKQTTGTFTDGETVWCYVAKYDNNRFAVWDVDFHHHNKYEVFKEEDLHHVFDEL